MSTSRIAIVALAWCACSSAETRVHLDLVADSSVDMYELHVGERLEFSGAASDFEITLPDDVAGEVTTFEVWGLAAGQQVAHGIVAVTPIAGSTVTVGIVLDSVACGTWCTLGDIVCTGDGKTECRQQPDGCVGWSQPVACAAATPYCSDGACAAQCSDECTIGETTCDSSVTMRMCGEHDHDACHDWSAPIACASGQTCQHGACIAVTTCDDGDACSDGDPCSIDDRCDAGTCSGHPKCTAPANADPTCTADGTCGFACRPGYEVSGTGCVPEPKLVFVSSHGYNGGLGGVAGGDAICQAHADAAGHQGTFKAWLSDATTNAAARLAHATSDYVLLDGTIVAHGWPGLTSGNLLHHIDQNEHGAFVLTSVWTGTTYTGEKSIDTCAGWTTATSANGLFGANNDTPGTRWTEIGAGACYNILPIYCLEQ